MAVIFPAEERLPLNSFAILEQGEGILWLLPTWVPRAAYQPGRRLKLHPDDLYAFGLSRGAINTRWLSSTTLADNGPLALPDEGLSYVLFEQSGQLQKRLLQDLVADLGATLLGVGLWERFRRWPVLSKLFDFRGSLPHHLHLQPQHAALVGREQKPEGYYFPLQLNAFEGDFPYTFFGLEPGVTREMIRERLETWDQGDNCITDLSRPYRLQVGTGWVLPPGTLHSPGSLVTYEPQWGSDVGAVFQNVVNRNPQPWSALVKDVPEDRRHDLDYLVSLLDWETNTCPDFKARYFRPPLPVWPLETMRSEGYQENWISYGSEFFAAKELTVLPGRSVTIRDAAPYGCVAIQGHGRLGRWPIESPTVIRFGQPTQDEYFVSYARATEGVRVENHSASEPLVILKHFPPNPEAPHAKGPENGR